MVQQRGLKPAPAAATGVAIILCLAFAATLRGQVSIPHADFETVQPVRDAAPGQWAASGATCFIDSSTAYAGRYAMKIVHAQPAGQGSFYQELPFTCHSLKKYVISAAIKTDSLQGTCGLGARVFDGAGNTISGYNAVSVTSNQGWTVMEGEFYADEKAARLRIFGNITGRGIAWFDNISVKEVPLTAAKPGKKAAAYIDEYFNYIKQYSVVKDSTRYLAQLKQNTQKLCAGHDKVDYCQNILKRYTTLKLNDGHSFFFTDEEWKQYREGSANTMQAGLVNYVSGHMTAEKMAYLNVPTFASLDKNILERYVDSAQAIIKSLDAQQPRGWIIDLGNNQGGNAFAMIVGLGPLLGNGICGYSQSANGSRRTRVYNNGSAGWAPDTTLAQQAPVYQLLHHNLPIALIYGSGTGSAGEVTAISFRGKARTRSFGQPTAGATTRVDNLEMSNGASFNLACGWDADRTGKVYKASVPPDVQTATPEEALVKATEWLLEQR